MPTIQPDSRVFSPPLKITLVTASSDVAPEDTDMLAQVDSLGETSALNEIPKLQQLQQKADSRQGQTAQDQSDYILSKESDSANISNELSSQATESSEDNLTREKLTKNINLAYLNSQSQPRERYVTRTKESKYAAYVEKWRQLVERVGNLNYPDAAKQQKLKGSLVLDVAISSDGSVGKVRVLNSSGHKILDDAAERIVYIAAPFDPFPKAIKAEVDILHIIRTWEFDQNRLISRNLDTAQHKIGHGEIHH